MEAEFDWSRMLIMEWWMMNYYGEWSSVQVASFFKALGYDEEAAVFAEQVGPGPQAGIRTRQANVVEWTVDKHAG